MANSKNTPSLPGSSRMQMPSTGNSTPKLSVNQNSKGASKKVMSLAKGKGMTGKNPYC